MRPRYVKNPILVVAEANRPSGVSGTSSTRRDERSATPNPAYATREEVEGMVEGVEYDVTMLAKAMAALRSGTTLDAPTALYLEKMVAGDKKTS